LSERLRRDDVHTLYQRYLRGYRGNDEVVCAHVGSCAQDLAVANDRYWPELLKVAQHNYRIGVVTSSRYYRLPRAIEESIPLKTAKKIIGKAEQLPRELVQSAAERCRTDIALRLVPLGDIAVKERWFDQRG
jgi:hypothetical protein